MSLYIDPLRYSCLENPMDRGAWQATVHGIARVRHDSVTKPPPPKLNFKPLLLCPLVHYHHYQFTCLNSCLHCSSFHSKSGSPSTIFHLLQSMFLVSCLVQIYWLRILIYWLKLFISVLLKYYFAKLLILGWELLSFNILNILFCVFWFLLTLLKVSYLPNCCSFKGSLPLFTSSCFKTFSLGFKISQLGPWCFSLYSF